MSTPAPAPVLTLSTDKATYDAGEEITVTAQVSAPAQNVITVSATLPDGTVVSAEITVTVNQPVTGDVQFGASDTLGDQFAIQSSSGGDAVLTTTAGTAPAA